MNILALNFGTSSVKYALFGDDGGTPAAHGQLGRFPQAREAIAQLRGRISTRVDAVAHRVVHGGSQSAAAIIDSSVLDDIERNLVLAPQHNRLALDSIAAARESWRDVSHVAVFDTAFHATMPAAASTYAVPKQWRAAGVRRYGFHGLSHGAVAEAVAATTGDNSLRIVSCHLGSGASVCAIAAGRSVDTSMGLTPGEGLVMATRSGDVDPGLIGFVSRTQAIGVDEVERQLHDASGMQALAGHGGDMQRIEAAAAAGDREAIAAIDVYVYRIVKYAGAYAAAMGGCDALAFAGGVGENSKLVRARVVHALQFLGFKLDTARNEAPDAGVTPVGAVHVQGASKPVFVVQAREEMMMARETRRLLAR